MSPDGTWPVDSSAQVNRARRAPTTGLSSAAGLRGGYALPPIGVLLARPLLLGVCLILGAIGGFLFTGGGKDSAATATVVFSSAGGNRDLVAVDGATLQRTIAPPYVLQRAAESIGEQASDLESRTTVAWQQDTRLLNITTTADTADLAVARANAVAEAAVAATEEARNERLIAALQEANALLNDAPLADPEAEIARRNQIGSSLGERQNEIKAEATPLILISPATNAAPIGLSRINGTAIGLACGLLTGALLAVLLGSRGLRVPGSGTTQRLAPDIDVLCQAELPRIAGELVDAGEPLVVVFATRGASLGAATVSQNLQRILAVHGKAVMVSGPEMPEEELASIPFILDDATPLNSARHTPRRSPIDSDIVLLNIDEGTEAASMLDGRTGFTTIIVVRRGKSRLSSALVAQRSFARSRSFMVVVAKQRAAR